MAMDQDAKVTIGGDGSGAQAAFRGVADHASRTASVLNDFTTKHLAGMQAGFNGLSGALGTVMGKFTMVAGLVAGGSAIFKESISDSVSFTKEVNSLSKVLHLSASEATAWNIALGDIYQDSGALIGALGKLNRVLADDEEKLTSLGIKTREANGHFRAQGDIFQDVTKYLSRFEEGTDRNVEGAKMFGKSWGEIAPLMKLNAEAIDAARAKAEELGLTVTKESAGNVAAYRGAMNDVGDVMLALKNVIGQAVMPIFTRLGEWFSSIGPGAVLVFKGVLDGFATFFQGLINGLVIAWELLSSAIYTALAPLIGLGKAVFYALHGDMKSATAAMMDWPTEVANTWGRAFDNIATSSARTQADIANLWSKGTDTGGKGNGEASVSKPKAGNAGSRMGEFANVLEQQKLVYAQAMLQQGKFMEWGHQEESRYWAGIMERGDLSREERLAASAKYYAAESKLRKEAFGAEMAEFSVRMEAARNDYAERDRIAEQAEAFAKEHYGAESKQYMEALKKRLEIARDHQDKLRDIARMQTETAKADELEVIAEREAQAQLSVDLGIAHESQLLEVKRQGIQERLQIELEALEAEQAAYKAGTVEYEQYEAKKAEIKRRAKGQLAANDRDKTKLEADPITRAMGVGENAFSQSMDAILAKGRFAGAELNKIWRQAGMSMVQELAIKPMIDWVAIWVKKLALNASFLATKNTQEAASAATTVATESSTGLASIAVSAARAAAGAYAAIASIPYVGPVLAPVAAGVALAGVLALGKSIFSAEGGMDIPAGTNPLIQAHAKEMVIPAKYADVIRGMADGGGGGGGGGRGDSFYISALDARSFERMLSGPAGDQMMRAIARRARNR